MKNVHLTWKLHPGFGKSLTGGRIEIQGTQRKIGNEKVLEKNSGQSNLFHPQNKSKSG